MSFFQNKHILNYLFKTYTFYFKEIYSYFSYGISVNIYLTESFFSYSLNIQQTVLEIFNGGQKDYPFSRMFILFFYTINHF